MFVVCVCVCVCVFLCLLHCVLRNKVYKLWFIVVYCYTVSLFRAAGRVVVRGDWDAS